MASIKKYDTAKGTAWRVQYRSPDGKSRTKQGFRTKAEAQRWAGKNATKIMEGSWIDPNAGKTLIRDLTETWWEGRQHLKASTLKADGYRKSQVLEYWGDRTVGSVKKSAVQAWVSSMGKSGSTVRHAHGVLLQILEVAVTDGLIVSNPARGVRLPRRNAPVKVFLTPAQLATLAKATGDEDGEHAVIVWVLGTVGLRWGELAGLKVEDIDFGRARIMVRRSVTYVGAEPVESAPKTHERREVSVSLPVCRMLRKMCEGKARGAWVFARGNGMPLRAVNASDGWFQAAVEAAKASDSEFPVITPHGLRHVAAGLLVQSGANVKVVQRQLGHASAAMTLDVYAALFDDDLDVVGRALGEKISDVVGLSWGEGKLHAV
ncbi:site-specific integrase [Corynebacterium ulcerans]|uniref:site-specific integrase n=1 Tax=Corynebacterium ulcerans TaxID=65058 RepID=UPI000E06014E|nr:site-specific integrase [Corynebacterium ulcerans]STC82202.1 Integrase [Corynebacterium ulcerans]STD70904.1 Integrase [Corynebacterium ulcerans]